MRNSVQIAFSYIRHYRKQTGALFLGVLLFSVLFSGISGLFSSGEMAARENARLEYGDWQYAIQGELPENEKIQKGAKGKGFVLEKRGCETIRKMIEEPFSISYVYADDDYLDIMGRKLLQGYYPKKENEIATDSSVLKNLGVPERLGSQVELDGEIFTLCGILTGMPEKLSEYQGDVMQVFVNQTLDYGENGIFYYLKFKEDAPVYKQLNAFCEQFGILTEDVNRNNGLAEYIDAMPPEAVFEVIQRGIEEEEAGFPYIWASLNSNGTFIVRIILGIIAFFGGFILYSLFQISVAERMSQYSVMYTMGMTNRHAFGILWMELGCICAVGYPVGCVLGNGIARAIYGKAGQIFYAQHQTYHTGMNDEVQEYAVLNLPDIGSYHINWDTMIFGAVFLVVVTAGISLLLIRRMNRLTVRQMLVKDTVRHRNRKIYSYRHRNMSGVLTRKFMFARKGTFVGILLSLSIGSTIFLGAYYVTENTEINNNLFFKVDDGLGSDIQIYEQSDKLTDVIPEEKAEQMKEISEITEFHPVRYLLGEVPIKDGKLKWTSYFAEIANDKSFPPEPELMDKYNGVIVQTGKDDYALKVNIYGYDDEMLKKMGDYVLEGEIDPDRMREEDSVIWKTIMGGQGDYDGIELKTGETIDIKTLKYGDVPQEALRFQGKASWYQNQTLKVAALASRPLAKVDTFIGDTGAEQVDIIMTNEQMEKYFGVTDYRTISISLDERADISAVCDELGKITTGIPQCVMKDYSQQIEAQNLYLTHKMFFYYGIAAMLFVISLIHIVNSMQYLVVARKREFGILRAMGITDSGFRKMLAREGVRYGMYSGIAVIIIYLLVQKVLYYFMVHIYLYLHPNACISWKALAGVIVLNLAICVGVVLISARMILRRQIDFFLKIV